MNNVGRNEPCPCGSGKKYKNCHQKKDKHKQSSNKAFIIGGLILLFVIAAIINFVIDMNSSSNSTRPEGPAPEGKVWSEEHGHYH